jgi:hypothetical protein
MPNARSVTVAREAELNLSTPVRQMGVENFYMPVGVIDPEFDGVGAADVDRDGAVLRIALGVVRTRRGMIAYFDETRADKLSGRLGQSFDKGHDIVVDEQSERVHVADSVLLRGETAIQVFESGPTGRGGRLVDFLREGGAVVGVLTVLKRNEKGHDLRAVRLGEAGEFSF